MRRADVRDRRARAAAGESMPVEDQLLALEVLEDVVRLVDEWIEASRMTTGVGTQSLFASVGQETVKIVRRTEFR